MTDRLSGESQSRGVRAVGISKSFRNPSGQIVQVLDDVSLTVPPGRIVGLRGPSGSGKSTLARIMAGLETADQGECYCDEVQVLGRAGGASRGRIGMVFQSPRRSCDPRMTLRRTISSTARKRDVSGLIKLVGLTDDLLERYPSQVSDGQLQRAALARTLAAEPSYLICDEVTAMLDAANAAAIIGVLRRYANDGGGVLLISHEHALLDATCGEIHALAPQPGNHAVG